MNEFISKPSDGYHLYVPSHQGIWVTAEFFNAQAKRYTLDDFEYVVSLAKSPLAVIAYSESDVNTPAELLKKLKETSKPITFAAGSGAHKLAFNYMATKAKINQDLVKTVGYRGPAQAATDVAGGHVEFGIVPIAVAAPIIKSGKIKLIGLCSEQTIAGFENAPLMNKTVPGMNVYAAWGIILPKGTPSVIREWYVTEFSKAIKSPEAKEFFSKNYMFTDPKELTPDGFKSSMMHLREQWIPILKDFKLE
jgi:tripartite-type tricarboxylate transporter receptor subunit TctC